MSGTPVQGCLIKATREKSANQCLDDCTRCGWNQTVAAIRKHEIRLRFKKTRKTREIRCPYCQARIDLEEDA